MSNIDQPLLETSDDFGKVKSLTNTRRKETQQESISIHNGSSASEVISERDCQIVLEGHTSSSDVGPAIQGSGSCCASFLALFCCKRGGGHLNGAHNVPSSSTLKYKGPLVNDTASVEAAIGKFSDSLSGRQPADAGKVSEPGQDYSTFRLDSSVSFSEFNKATTFTDFNHDEVSLSDV